MRSILEKIGAFFEAHAEKFVLVVVLVICGWVLLTRVVFSPNRIEYDSQSFSPTYIDEYITETYAGKVIGVLESTPQKATHVAEGGRLDGYIDPNDPVREGIKGELEHGFNSILQNSILAVNSKLTLPLPGAGQTEDKGGGGIGPRDGEERDYRLPTMIGEVWDVDVEHIRAAAYVPTEPLSDDLSYDQAKPEPNDVDLVTVQATFNAASLYRRFYDSFAGDDVREEWRDEELAKPVFGAVNLQRQEQMPNGSWGEWRDVPRIAIENKRQLFATIEKVQDLPPGGVPVRLLELKDSFNQAQLLQPAGYSMASAHEEWYPPALHREYTAAYEKIKKQERREERESERDQRDTGRRRGGDNTTNTRSRTRGGGADAMGYGGEYGGMDRGRGRSTRGRTGRGGADMMGYGGEYGTAAAGRGTRGRPTRGAGAGGMEEMYGYGGEMGMGMGMEQSPVTEVLQKYNEVKITPRTDLSEETELLFWAHDDTVEPGKTYRYRIRLGVLNPTAGTNYLADEDQAYQDQVLLWSEHSEESEPVSVPKRSYFFASSYREDTQTMNVIVAKYLLGYWRVEPFAIKPGETIGQVKKTRTEEEERQANAMMMGAGMGMEGYGMPMMMQDQITSEPDEIDYRTDAVFLGVSKTTAWTGGNRLRESVLYRMLYAQGDAEIAHAPVSSAHWDAETRTIQAEIQREKRREKEEFKSFTAPSQNQMMSPFGMDPYGYGG